MLRHQPMAARASFPCCQESISWDPADRSLNVQSSCAILPFGFGDLAAARVQLVCTPPAAQASCCQPRPPGPGQRQQRQWRPQLVEALRVCACVYGLPAPPASQQAVPLHDLARHVYAMRYAYPYANLAMLACLRRVSTDASSPPPPPPLPHNQEACRRDQAHAGP